jgi:hypothetical protein
MIAVELSLEEIEAYLPEFEALLRRSGKNPDDVDPDFLRLAATEALKRVKLREAFARQFDTTPIAQVANRWATARLCACAGVQERRRCNTCGWSDCEACRGAVCVSCGTAHTVWVSE